MEQLSVGGDGGGGGGGGRDEALVDGRCLRYKRIASQLGDKWMKSMAKVVTATGTVTQQ